MIPLAACSVIARSGGCSSAGCACDRGSSAAARRRSCSWAPRADFGPARALDLARAHPTVLSKVVQPVLERWSESRPALEKAVEDVGSRELRAPSPPSAR